MFLIFLLGQGKLWHAWDQLFISFSPCCPSDWLFHSFLSNLFILYHPDDKFTTSYTSFTSCPQISCLTTNVLIIFNPMLLQLTIISTTVVLPLARHLHNVSLVGQLSLANCYLQRLEVPPLILHFQSALSHVVVYLHCLHPGRYKKHCAEYACITAVDLRVVTSHNGTESQVKSFMCNHIKSSWHKSLAWSMYQCGSVYKNRGPSMVLRQNTTVWRMCWYEKYCS